MKKINKLILLLIMTIPFMVKADMSAPVSKYKVRVSNPEGAYIYEYNHEKTEKKLEYDEIYTTMYDGDEYIYLDQKGYVKASDVSPLEVSLNDYKHDYSQKIYVADNNSYLYNGPSKHYNKIVPEVNLEKGTVLESYYYDEMWIYVEYKNAKGWLYFGHPKSPYKDFKNNIIHIYEPYVKKIKLLKEAIMYSYFADNKELGITIPKNTILNPTLSANDYYEVEYENSKGWIKIEEEKDIFEYEDSQINICNFYDNEVKLQIKNESGAILYEVANASETNIDIIPFNTELVAKCYLMASHEPVWYEVEYNGKTGFVHLKDLKIIYSENENIDSNNLDTNDEDITINKSNDLSKYLIYIVSIVVVLSLTAVVTIILINKNKKSKNNVK